MTRTLLTFAALAAFTVPAAATCIDKSDFKQIIMSGDFGEVRFVGVSGNGHVLTLLVKDNGEWVTVRSSGDGTTCLDDAGSYGKEMQ